MLEVIRLCCVFFPQPLQSLHWWSGWAWIFFQYFFFGIVRLHNWSMFGSSLLPSIQAWQCLNLNRLLEWPLGTSYHIRLGVHSFQVFHVIFIFVLGNYSSLRDWRHKQQKLSYIKVKFVMPWASSGHEWGGFSMNSRRQSGICSIIQEAFGLF